MNKDFAYLVGYWFGDGFYRSNQGYHQFVLCGNEEDLVKVYEASKRLRSTRRVRWNRYYSHWNLILGTRFNKLLMGCGIKGWNTAPKTYFVRIRKKSLFLLGENVVLMGRKTKRYNRETVLMLRSKYKAQAMGAIMCSLGVHVWVRGRQNCFYCKEPRNGRWDWSGLVVIILVVALGLIIFFVE